MKWRIIFITLAVLIVMGVAFYFSYTFTGSVVEEQTYTHTKAICNRTEKGNIYCEDYEITCRGNETINSVGTGFFVQHNADWKDPRGENGSEIICG